MNDRKKIPINHRDAAKEESPPPADPDFASEASDRGEPVSSDEAGLQTGAEDSSQSAEAMNDEAPRDGIALEQEDEARPGNGVEAGVDAVTAVAAERDAYYQSLLRLKAEFDNFRRRSAREAQEVRGRSQAEVLREFLPVLDNLARALAAAEHHEEGKVLEGVRLTYNIFQDLLKKQGVEEINPAGEPFDPEFHEAMAFHPSDQPEGTVTNVMEVGYRTDRMLLRPARVAVSAGERQE